ncbi:FecR domain-containing protein [Pseudomonas sp. GD03860]|uniref:FecR family protein n=1 Tax=Pseudomonas TaxID=286 RepID=UPI0023641EBD|nr:MULTISPECIES: FecR domain-containing protein [Pseudomonas]MDD2056693.1 FecR domain-containing protein [Pseudomonas putida]MDH0638113.1 FecR domain-containing protein [Pseudomonas sp. GD03860]
MHADDSIEAQAAEWVLRLSEGELSEQERQAFERWRQLDSRHQATFDRIDSVVAQLHSLRTQRRAVRAALEVSGKRRSKIPRARHLLGIGVLLASLGLAMHLGGYRVDDLFVDLHTAPGEWQTRTLEDGSRITLYGNSAVDLNFDNGQRRVELQRGQVLVDVAPDPGRPFVVVTDDGSFTALGTRFVVSRGDEQSELSMLHSSVAAQSADHSQSLQVRSGGRVWVRPDALGRLPDIDPASFEQAWQGHQLVVEQWPLPQVLEALGRQRRGHVQFDASALADLKVSAVLPLDDTERALQLLAQALPIRLQSFTPLWTRIERLPAEK